MANKEKDPTGEFSSYYGCYIIAMAALVFIGILAWSGWTLFSQDKAISLITQDEIVVLTNEKISPEAEKARSKSSTSCTLVNRFLPILATVS